MPGTADARGARLVDVPKGWKASIQRPMPGVEVIRMRRDNQAISVAAIGPNAPVRIEHVLARNRIAGKGKRTDRTTKTCRRHDCVVGINGAFFDRNSGLPYSGIISAGELIRSVTSKRPHVGIGDGLSFGQTTPSVELVATEPDVFSGGSGFEQQEHRFGLRGVNRARGQDGLVVYTRRWGGSAPGTSGRELVMRVEGGDPALTVGTRKTFVPIELRAPGGPVPADGVVLSGTGTAATTLEDLWRRVEEGTLLPGMTLEIDPAPPTLIGTRPLILRNKQVLVDRSSFGRAKHPRSILAAKPDGTILFVVIDGRATKRKGMSLRQAAWLVRALGASDAANLDGGGSSTLTIDGRLHSNPAGSERAVATSLLAIPF